jgi:hypothetical protein
MYRARNIRVHGGLPTNGVESLVVNLHSYVDQIVDAVVARLAIEAHRVELEKVYFEFSIEYKAYTQRLDVLAKGDAAIKRAPIWELIAPG